jgi:nickel-dependent lactate racemase
VVTVVGASGDGAAVAAKFSGIVIPGISNTAAVATNSSGTVTITWPNTGVRVGDDLAKLIVANILNADTTLTSPITVNVATLAELI